MTALTTRRLGAFIARAGTAASLIAAVNWIFNYPFTLWIVLHFDPIPGLLIWSAVGIALNYACVAWYKKTALDWFGLEWLRMWESIDSEKLTAKAIKFFLNRSRILTFGLICLFLDPIYGFMYQRGRVSGARFDLHDWKWFILANFLGMLPWILGAHAIVEIAIIGVDVVQKAAE